jgi:hypothetical protein
MERIICFFRGHEFVPHFEHDRLSLRCLGCDYRTPGWPVGGQVPDSIVMRLPRQQRVEPRHRAA